MKLTTSTAAAALGVPVKTLDNVLTRRPRALAPAGRRGRRRQLSFQALEHVAIALLLQRDLGTPIETALRLARALVAGDGHHAIGSIGVLRLDLARLRASLERSVAVALEETALPRRGRPAGSTHKKSGAPSVD
ncbi:MAG: hypothetical protein HYR75_05905 [Gemmatimonadetes bacterium]|nr:hypothetical protein [Gemmatimonadota bacterium]MBI3504609.1 hypothetical protein [Pseudomonadota bacterium]